MVNRNRPRPPTPSEARTLVSCRAAVLVVLASHLEQQSDPPNEDPNAPPDCDEEDVVRLLEVVRPHFPWLTRKSLMDYVGQHRRLYRLDQEGGGDVDGEEEEDEEDASNKKSSSAGGKKGRRSTRSSSRGTPVGTKPAKGSPRRRKKKGAAADDGDAEEEEAVEEGRKTRSGRRSGGGGVGRKLPTAAKRKSDRGGKDDDDVKEEEEETETEAEAEEEEEKSPTSRGGRKGRGRPPKKSTGKNKKAVAKAEGAGEEEIEGDDEEQNESKKRKRTRGRKNDDDDNNDDDNDDDDDEVEEVEKSSKASAAKDAPSASELLAGLLQERDNSKAVPNAAPSLMEAAAAVTPCRGKSSENKSDAKFYVMIDLLKQFRDERGHSRVPDTLRYEKENKYYELAKWVMEIRKTYKRMQTATPTHSANLSPERVSALTALGFEFRIMNPARVFSWDDRLEQCRKFKEEHGHLCIPVSHPDLGQWCSHMRTQHKINREGNAHSKSFRGGKIHKRTFLTPKREEQLNELGFVWQVRKRRRVGEGGPKPFEVRFGELEAFKAKHGHLRVTRNIDADLYGWVCYQRSDYRLMMEGKKHHMTADKLRQLNEIGFVFHAPRVGGKSALEFNEDDMDIEDLEDVTEDVTEDQVVKEEEEDEAAEEEAEMGENEDDDENGGCDDISDGGGDHEDGGDDEKGDGSDELEDQDMDEQHEEGLGVPDPF